MPSEILSIRSKALAARFETCRSTATIHAITLAALVACAHSGYADAGGPNEPASDVPGHTLFNPTPDDQMRQMATDRPNVTNTPQTIDAGHLQVELGLFDFARSQTSPTSTPRSLVFGHTNFRLGILDNLEVNAAIDSYDVFWNTQDASGRTQRQSGLGDMTIGGTLNFWGDDGSDDAWATALAVQPQLKLPTAQSGLGNGHPEFSISLPFTVNLPADFISVFRPA